MRDETEFEFEFELELDSKSEEMGEEKTCAAVIA